MSEPISVGASAAYRAASEALHKEPVADRQAARFAKLWECGFADLIRADFYSLLDLTPEMRGNLLDAGCGTGIEIANLRGLAPELSLHGVDISGVALADAAARSDAGSAGLYQGTLERLPFADGSFDYISSHEVIEHIADPALVLHEFWRVLKPGGICAIATPNGASLWLEHLRQRVKRAMGRRGAAIGEDHTRPPSFWRREFRRAGFAVERQIFGGAALEFQMLIAPPSWMPFLSRVFEPLRAVPGINWLLCDRVKFRLVKPGETAIIPGPVTTCCPICHATLSERATGALCTAGHRFLRNQLGVIDFTRLAPQPTADAGGVPENPGQAHPQIARSSRRRQWRRVALIGLSAGYAGFLLLLAPLGAILSAFHQPFRQPPLTIRPK